VYATAVGANNDDRKKGKKEKKGRKSTSTTRVVPSKFSDVVAPMIAGLKVMSSPAQVHHTDYATCDIHSNNPHLCTGCGLQVIWLQLQWISRRTSDG